jgi:hypothetical protein
VASKQPTPQAVAAVLRRAGFVRSDYHRKGVAHNAASTGFRVWRTASRAEPGVPLIAVAHYDRGQHGGYTDDEAREVWAAHVKSAQRMCMRYADAIVVGGYLARLQFSGDDPMVLVAEKTVRRG